MHSQLKFTAVLNEVSKIATDLLAFQEVLGGKVIEGFPNDVEGQTRQLGHALRLEIEVYKGQCNCFASGLICFPTYTCQRTASLRLLSVVAGGDC